MPNSTVQVAALQTDTNPQTLRGTAPERSQPTRIEALTSLRFFAAALVVLFHCGGPLFRHAPTIAANIVSNGGRAVSFFFVLSGFVLTTGYMLPNGRLKCNVRSFYTLRVARIYPVYFAALALALPLFVYSFRYTPSDAHWTAPHAVSFFLVPALVQAWWPSTAMDWVVPAWSLSVEATLYLLFPGIAELVGRLSRRQLVVAAGAAAVGVEIIRCLGPGAAQFLDAYRANPLLHVPEFFLGIAAARLCSGWELGRTSRVLLVASCIALVTILFALFPGTQILPVCQVALLVAYTGLLVGLAKPVPGFSRWLERRTLLLLGNASYALYLVHTTVFTWLVVVSRVLTPTRSAYVISNEPTTAICACVASVLVSLSLYSLVEVPARGAIIRVLSGARRTLATAERTQAAGA